MKKSLILFAAVVFQLLSLQAADLTGVKIYLNPGHGGYEGANDRNLETIPYALGDTLGFWESWSNLRKALALRDRLEIIDLNGYAVEEKVQIAKRHLLPKVSDQFYLPTFRKFRCEQSKSATEN